MTGEVRFVQFVFNPRSVFPNRLFFARCLGTRLREREVKLVQTGICCVCVCVDNLFRSSFMSSGLLCRMRTRC